MNTFIRWGKFNLVGAMGMVVQLAALALFSRWAAGHYLYASAAALELTLLHNFVWHLHYTWRDRRDDSTLFAQLIRFHLSNGLVSMLGNLALMRILVDEARMPLLAANSIAILCCSAVNFCLGNNWVFALEAGDFRAKLPQKTPKDLRFYAQVFWRKRLLSGALPAQYVGKNQWRDDRGVRLDDEFGRILAQLAPGDLLVGNRSGVGAVTGCGITDLAEIGPQRHVLALQVLMQHRDHADGKIA
ncbi:MAG: GtrA family protein, partial [Terracidiphilus sp.]